MMRRYTYIIEGEPIPLARPRLSKMHNKIYDSQKHEKFLLGIGLRNQHDDRPPFEGPVRLDITFFMPVPLSRIKEKKSLMDSYHYYRADLSNMVKFYEDLAQDCGILKDDCLIAEIFAKKIYGEPRTEFTITSLK
jgi:Holliday junction resolvase RusA-like endonuclease